MTKLIKSGIGVIMMILLATMAVAANETEDGREADHAALQALMAKAVAAINTQDMDTLASCFCEKFAFTTVDQTVLTNTLSLKRYYDRMLRAESSPLSAFAMHPKVEMPAIFLDADSAYSRGSSDDTYTLKKGGKTIHMTSRWTAAVAKENGQWKLAAVHSGINLMDNPVLAIKTLPWWRRLLLAVGIGKYPGEK